MVEVSQGYDVGLALEQPHVLNHDLCLSNKAFTYMLAGLAVAMTDTRGQKPLALDMGAGAVLYRPGDVKALAEKLQCWAKDKSRLARAKAAAWEAARRRWHWDHPLERGALIRLVESVVGCPDKQYREDACAAS
jgi:glycosyltransferase involved in cell wall biosynthesis